MKEAAPKKIDITLGEEGGAVVCSTCRDSNGSKVLFDYHNGYGEEAKPTTEKQETKMDNVAESHPGSHEVREIFFHSK